MYGLDPLTGLCTYSTPCGWCVMWDKKCDKKIGCDTKTNNPKNDLLTLEEVLDKKGMKRYDELGNN